MRPLTFLVALVACSPQAPLPDEPTGCPPEGCITCDTDASFYADQCPDVHAWCNNNPAAPAGRCPAGLEPLFCGEFTAFEWCVATTATACGPGVAATFCCDPDLQPLGPEFYCDVGADCPTGSECLVGECWPFGPTDAWPDLYGTAGHCVYVPVAEGAACVDGGDHCENGACVAYLQSAP